MDSDEELSHRIDDTKSTLDEESVTMTSPRSGRSIKRQRAQEHSQFEIPVSPPTFVSMRQLTEAANAFYNMTLAHEITVDSEFRIEKYEPPEKSLERAVKETMHRAFWDLLRSSLEANPPDYSPALRLLGEIKESLNGLVLPNQKSLQKLIDDSLDLSEAENQIQQTGHLNLEAYAVQVINVMRQFCAPVRDQEVENLRKIDDPVEAFRNAFILLEKMHMDLANFTIAQMRPYIRQQAVNYERAKFDEFLTTQKALGIDGLRKTREWITTAYRCISPNPQSPLTNQPTLTTTAPFSLPSLSHGIPSMVVENEDNEENNVIPTPNNILREAYLALLTWPTDKDWPETMLMDRQRMIDLGIQLENIVSLTALVLVTCNFVAANSKKLPLPEGRSATDPVVIRGLKQLLLQAAIFVLSSDSLEFVDERAKAMADEVVCALERWMNDMSGSRDKESSQDSTEPSRLHNLPHDLADALISQVTEVVRGQHPVYALMHKRAVGFLRTALSSNPPDPLPVPPGFSILLTATQSSTANADISTAGPSTIPSMTTGLKSTVNKSHDDKEGITTSVVKRLQNPSQLSLSNLAGRLLPLLAHNRHVFGPKYAEIIQGLLIPLDVTVVSSAVSEHAAVSSSEDLE